MERKKIAIACQGGGTHTAFTAGVLKRLLAEGVHQQYDLVGLSGTSGGGICALTAWYGLLKAAKGDTQPPYQGLLEFWQDNAANLPWERSLNALMIQSVRWQNSGVFPVFATSPYSSEWFLYWLQSVSPRQEYLDFASLLQKHLDFREIQELVDPASPRLLLGAVNTSSGDFKAFDSKKGEINLETVMASAAIPNFFKAVEIGQDNYWDGLCAKNPPISDLLEIEMEKRPEEIWIIQIIPPFRPNPALTPLDIQDRRNELAGNLSLKQDLKFIELVNQWLKMGYFQELSPQHFQPVAIRWIRMSPEVSDRLDYASKLNRDSSFIQMLMADGEKQAMLFLNRSSG